MSEVTDRFWSKVETSADGCWLWTAARFRTGYGAFGIGGFQVGYAHRIAYLTLIGPIPPGLELDHLCRVRHCVNPLHLEPVTHSENVRRGTAWHVMAGMQRAKTHCPSGHPYAGENLYRYKGKRMCRACGKARKAQRRISA